MRAIPRACHDGGCLILLLLAVGAAACQQRPRIRADLIHPDVDKSITFIAERGDVEGDIDRMRIVAGDRTWENSGDSAQAEAEPFPERANERLTFRAVAIRTDGSEVESESPWVYVADPIQVLDTPTVAAAGPGALPVVPFRLPDGDLEGWPAGVSQQTGPNLYRLDQDAVTWAAQNLILEYSNEANLPVATAPPTCDGLVEEVAAYACRHVDFKDDVTMRYLYQNHLPGVGDRFSRYEAANPDPPEIPDEFAQPADLMIERGGETADYQGDCEDQAILRAALLRRLGFSPWAIWHARCPEYFLAGAGEWTSHEYNIVLYEGAFRVMDNCKIDVLLDAPSDTEKDKYKSAFGWNETHGPRFADDTAGWLREYVDNYPGGKSDGHGWSHEIYFRSTSP